RRRLRHPRQDGPREPARTHPRRRLSARGAQHQVRGGARVRGAADDRRAASRAPVGEVLVVASPEESGGPRIETLGQLIGTVLAYVVMGAAALVVFALLFITSGGGAFGRVSGRVAAGPGVLRARRALR